MSVIGAPHVLRSVIWLEKFVISSKVRKFGPQLGSNVCKYISNRSTRGISSVFDSMNLSPETSPDAATRPPAPPPSTSHFSDSDEDGTSSSAPSHDGHLGAARYEGPDPVLRQAPTPRTVSFVEPCQRISGYSSRVWTVSDGETLTTDERAMTESQLEVSEFSSDNPSVLAGLCATKLMPLIRRPLPQLPTRSSPKHWKTQVQIASTSAGMHWMRMVFHRSANVMIPD